MISISWGGPESSWTAQSLAACDSAFQAAGLLGVTVPDVSGDADPQSGYRVRVDGGQAVFGDTSAVAPLWAGLIARINAVTPRPAGFLNPMLYNETATLHDVVSGSDGRFSASTGWDACTGLAVCDDQSTELRSCNSSEPSRGRPIWTSSPSAPHSTPGE